MANWFCKIGGKIYGPYRSEELRRLAEEGRLLPLDSLREGETGAWFPAREMPNLFPETAPAPRGDRDDWDDDDDDDFARPRQRKKRGKPSNYYRVMLRNLQNGGQWTQLLLITLGLQILIPVLVLLVALLFSVIGGPARHEFGPSAIALGIIVGAAMAFGLLALFFFVDVLIFGIPCTIFRVRLDERRDSVLDLFGFSYLIGLIPTLIINCSGLASYRLGIMLWLMYPFFHGAVLAYLMCNYWGLPGGRSLTLAGIRFGYQMLLILVLVIVRLQAIGGGF